MKIKTKINLDSYYPFLLRTISAHINRGTSTTIVKGHQIGMREWRIIALLADKGVMDSKEICLNTGMDKASVSRALSDLRNQTLVEQAGSSKDWRSKPYALTNRGIEVYEELATEKVKRADQLWANLDKTEQKQLITLLQKLRKNIFEALLED